MSDQSRRDLSPDSAALLAEIMRERRDKVTAEMAQLQQELHDIEEWLTKHDSATPPHLDGEQ